MKPSVRKVSAQSCSPDDAAIPSGVFDRHCPTPIPGTRHQARQRQVKPCDSSTVPGPLGLRERGFALSHEMQRLGTRKFNTQSDHVSSCWPSGGFGARPHRPTPPWSDVRTRPHGTVEPAGTQDLSVRLEEKPENDPRTQSTLPICWCREDAAGQFLSTRNSPLIQRTRAQSSDSPAGYSLRSDYVSSQPPDRSGALSQFWRPPLPCRHSDQERDGMSAAPQVMCFGSASQEDVPPLPCGRGGSPWARSRNLVGETSIAAPPCCHLAEAQQPSSRMDHSPPPHADGAWSGTHHTDVLGMD